MLVRETQIRQHLVLSHVHQLCHAREAWSEAVGHSAPGSARCGRIWLHEHGADRGSDHLLSSLLDDAQRVSNEMDAATLPGCALHDRSDRHLQATVRITYDQSDAAQPTCDQAAQEGQPKGATLG